MVTDKKQLYNSTSSKLAMASVMIEQLTVAAMTWHDHIMHALTPLTLHALGQDTQSSLSFLRQAYIVQLLAHMCYHSDPRKAGHKAMTGNMAELAHSPILS